MDNYLTTDDMADIYTISERALIDTVIDTMLNVLNSNVTYNSDGELKALVLGVLNNV